MTVSVASLLAITSSPMLLNDAPTNALPATFALMALTRSATVSVPVDVYVVVLVPSLTLIVPVAGIPSVNSEVLLASGTVPVPVAGSLEKLEEAEKFAEREELELEEDEAELPELAFFCRAAIWLLTRSKAV